MRIALALFTCFAAGCGRSDPAPPKPAPPPLVKAQDDSDHPVVKEALAETELILMKLVTGKAGDDSALTQIATKVDGFDQWLISKQELQPGEPKTVAFTGVLTGPRGEGNFKMTMTKQKNGKWAVGTFQGPNPVEK